MRPMAAVMTIAASIGRGRSRSRPGAKTSSRAIVTAPTSGVSWLRAPAETATGVRDALEEMAKPRKKPAARLAAPRARSSWLGSTVSPRWAARDWDSTVVSATATRAIPRAPLISAPRSARSTAGKAKAGRPSGSTPMTLTPSWSRSKAATAAMPTTTATATAGMARQNRLRTRMTTIPVSPTARAARRPGFGPAERQDHGRDHRRQRRVGPEDHHPGGPEHGVCDQGHDGGVQPGDRGQPGRLGVAHAHRDQQGGQDEPSDQVAGQPGAPVLPQGAKPRDPALRASRRPTAHLV